MEDYNKFTTEKIHDLSLMGGRSAGNTLEGKQISDELYKMARNGYGIEELLNRLKGNITILKSLIEKGFDVPDNQAWISAHEALLIDYLGNDDEYFVGVGGEKKDEIKTLNITINVPVESIDTTTTITLEDSKELESEVDVNTTTVIEPSDDLFGSEGSTLDVVVPDKSETVEINEPQVMESPQVSKENKSKKK